MVQTFRDMTWLQHLSNSRNAYCDLYSSCFSPNSNQNHSARFCVAECSYSKSSFG